MKSHSRSLAHPIEAGKFCPAGMAVGPQKWQLARRVTGHMGLVVTRALLTGTEEGEGGEGRGGERGEGEGRV